MRKLGWIAVVAGVVAFAGPAWAQCAGMFHTASDKAVVTAETQPAPIRPVEQDKKG